MNKLGLVLGVITLITACSSFKSTDFASNDKQQFLTSRNGPELVVPSRLTTNNISDFYVLPSQNQPAKVGVNPPKT